MNIMDKIRLRQAHSELPSSRKPPKHQPEMLYIGCIDARLDPIDDIGINKGAALIMRNIGALVLKDTRASSDDERQMIPTGGDVPQHISTGAVLEFFLGHLTPPPGKIKHIVISGHTDCGGLQACLHGEFHAHDHYLPLYLEGLKEVRAKITNVAVEEGWDRTQLLHALEEESVRQSIRNLQTYPVVRQAMQEGMLELHGWVINTATQRISQMNPQTLAFEPMAKR